jgi:hypothetical protein
MAEEDAKFSHQAYLSSYIDDIAEESTSDFNFVNKLITKNVSLPETFALLTGKSGNFSFTRLSSYQYSSIIPKVRIYRVDSQSNKETEYEFIFNKDTKLNNVNVLGDNLIRDNSAGIKSINWTLAGTNPVTAERNIECSIEFYFSSINAFSGGNYDAMLDFWGKGNQTLSEDSPFDDNKLFTTRNYWALLFHPSLKNNNSSYETTKFRIKAVIGWEDIDPNILSNIFKGFDNINEELQDSNLVMYLNLVRHNFSFNEDGSVIVKAEYIASFENALFNYKYDLFRGLKSYINSLNTKFEYKTNSGPQGETVNYEREKAKLNLIKSLINGDNETLKSCNDEVQLSLDQLKKLPPDLVQQQITALEARADAIQGQIKIIATQIKRDFYSNVINRIIKNGKLYSISLTAEDITNWLDWKNADNDQKPNNFSETIETVDKQASPTGLTVSLSENNTDVQVESQLDQLKNDIESREINVTDQIVYFTTIGHLIDSACFALVEGPEFKTLEGYNYDLQGRDIKDGNRFTEGQILEFKKNIITFSSFDEEGIRNISDIPIAYNNLLQFFIDKVYRPQKTEYSLYQFVKDVITTLVEPALNLRSVQNKEINKYSNISLATNIITLKSLEEEPNTPPLKYIADATSTSQQKNTIDLNGITRESIKQLYPKSTNKGGKYYFYYIIYDKYLKDFDGKGNIVEDSRKGIYHYTIGQDYGLVKSINFKRNDQPYLRESKSIGKKTLYLGQFRDIYAADIKMVGNNIYTPGMILLLKPSVEFGEVIGNLDDKKPSFSQITGVGGYYSVIKVSSNIDENGYSTSLECLFHSNEPKRKRQSAGSECEEQLVDYASVIGEISGDLQQIIDSTKQTQDSTFYKLKQAAKDLYESDNDSLAEQVVSSTFLPGYGIKKAYDYFTKDSEKPDE